MVKGSVQDQKVVSSSPTSGRVEKQKKNSTECTQLYPQKMSRWLSPHPDGWDVKPEVPGDLASRGVCLFQPQ